MGEGWEMREREGKGQIAQGHARRGKASGFYSTMGSLWMVVFAHACVCESV